MAAIGTVNTDNPQDTGARALVPLGAAGTEPVRPRVSQRPFAPFLAHLIATAAGAPQTCERRRIEPRIGASRYEAGNAARPARPSQTRSL